MEQLRFFSYDETLLTDEQKEQIAKAKAWTAETLKHLDDEEMLLLVSFPSIWQVLSPSAKDRLY